MNSHRNAQLIRERIGHPGNKVARIDHIQTIHLSPVLICIVTADRQKRLVIMARFPAHGFYTVSSVRNPCSVNLSFPRPVSVHGNHVKLLVWHIDTGAHHLCQRYRLFRTVLYGHISCHHIRCFKYTVFQNHLQMQQNILRSDFQRLNIRSRTEGRRQSRNCFFARIDLMGNVL